MNLDQLQLDPQAPRTRIRAMFIATNTKKTLGGSRRGRRPAVPAVLFVGYSAVAGTFDSQIPVLEDLLARIQLESRAPRLMVFEPGKLIEVIARNQSNSQTTCGSTMR